MPGTGKHQGRVVDGVWSDDIRGDHRRPHDARGAVAAGGRGGPVLARMDQQHEVHLVSLTEFESPAESYGLGSTAARRGLQQSEDTRRVAGRSQALDHLKSQDRQCRGMGRGSHLRCLPAAEPALRPWRAGANEIIPPGQEPLHTLLHPQLRTDLAGTEHEWSQIPSSPKGWDHSTLSEPFFRLDTPRPFQVEVTKPAACSTNLQPPG